MWIDVAWPGVADGETQMTAEVPIGIPRAGLGFVPVGQIVVRPSVRAGWHDRLGAPAIAGQP